MKVHFRIVEGEKERIQVFQGNVSVCTAAPCGRYRDRSQGLRRRGRGTYLPLHSPFIDHIELVTEGSVRRSRLYYLRDLKGKAARIKPKKRYQFPIRKRSFPRRRFHPAIWCSEKDLSAKIPFPFSSFVTESVWLAAKIRIRAGRAASVPFTSRATVPGIPVSAVAGSTKPGGAALPVPWLRRR